MIEYSFRYAVTLKSTMQVLSELLTVSESAIQRLSETRDGFVAVISVANVPNTGAIYIYDRGTSSIFNLSVDGRDFDFSEKEIANMFPEVVKHLNTPSKKQQVTNRKKQFTAPVGAPAQHRNHNRRRRTNSVNMPARPVMVSVAA